MDTQTPINMLLSIPSLWVCWKKLYIEASLDWLLICWPLDRTFCTLSLDSDLDFVYSYVYDLWTVYLALALLSPLNTVCYFSQRPLCVLGLLTSATVYFSSVVSLPYLCEVQPTLSFSPGMWDICQRIKNYDILLSFIACWCSQDHLFLNRYEWMLWMPRRKLSKPKQRCVYSKGCDLFVLWRTSGDQFDLHCSFPFSDHFIC